MKTRSFTSILASVIAIAMFSLTSCSERSYIEFDSSQKNISAEAQVVELNTNLPVEFIGVMIEDGKQYLECSYSNGKMECSHEWFTISSDSNGRKVTIRMNENNGSAARQIKVQAINRGVATNCTLIQGV